MTMNFLKSEKKYDALHPRLTEVLELIYAKRPLLEYCVEQTVDSTNGQILAITVSAWQHGQCLGRIFARYSKYSPSKGSNVMWFAVECRQIRKERGTNRDTQFFKQAKGAAKLAIELFSKKTLAELGGELFRDIAPQMRHLTDRVIYGFKDTVRMSDVSARAYFVEKHLGNNPPTPSNVRVTEESIRAYENMKIATNVMDHFNAKNGYAIRFMRDETLLVTDLRNSDQTFKYQSTYDMSPFMQEKFTMLKLLDNNQFAANIGVKLMSPSNDFDSLYFIVAGETVTH